MSRPPSPLPHHHGQPLESRYACAGLSMLRPLLVPMACMLVVLWLSRLGLSLWQAPRVSQTQAWSHVLLQGLRFDAVLLGLIWVLPAALTPWMALNPTTWRAWRAVLRVYGLLAVLWVALMEMCTPAFISQYDSRPNYQFVEYLGYTQEVGGTLLKDYGLHLLAAAVLLPLLLVLYWRLTRPTLAPRAPMPRWFYALPYSVLLLLALALSARGTLGHRPLNPASAALTSDHLVNELPLNSAYSLLYAIYLSRTTEAGITYGSLPRTRVIELVRQNTGLPAAAFTDNELPLRHLHTTAHPRSPALNLVIVLEESLGAEFVGKLGGLPLTPNLDRLSSEGLWFDQLYATGTRSVRGIEAVIAGYPPTSALSTVKLAKSQRGFFTLASFLKTHGYESTFFYGGESHFDNMRGFFLGNGFDRVVEQKDFGSQAFIGTWGASDADVMNKAHDYFRAQPAHKPFFGLIFTSSNHTPFEFPDGQIALHEQPKATVNNAVKYADHALGQFIAQAKTAPYWHNTLFLIVADHNSRVYGNSLFPVERFHIPGLILGGSIQTPQRISQMASQIDLPPTLISLMGLSGPTPLIGRDLSSPHAAKLPGRAIMQLDKTQAYMQDTPQGPQVVLLRADQAPLVMRYRDRTLEPDTHAGDHAALVEKAIAQSLYAQMAYRERLHR